MDRSGYSIGSSPSRIEDPRFLTGKAQFGDDIALPGQVFAAFLTSPVPAGRITTLDCEQARALPGVLGVFTHDDLDHLGPLPCTYADDVGLRAPDGKPMTVPLRPALVDGHVRFVGDLIAMVVAHTPQAANDALEAIVLDVADAAFVITPQDAAAEGAPLVRSDCADNTAFVLSVGDGCSVARAIADAPYVARVTVPFTRVAATPLEPRTALAAPDPETGGLTLHCGTQVPHLMRAILSKVLEIPQDTLRLITPEIGGSFGMRSNAFPEMALVLWAARHLKCAVRWTGTRSDAFLTDDMGRDVTMTGELALDTDGRFLAFRVTSVAALGAYLSTFGPLPATSNLGGLAGVYRTPLIAATVRGVWTNTPPIAPYRGAGRPEAVTCIEMAIDQAARQFGFDRVTLRRRNLIGKDEMPFATGLSYIYDSGDFSRSMDMAMTLADVDGFPARQEDATRLRGALRGIGIVNAIEAAASRADEEATINVATDGRVTLVCGSVSQGQGHETVLRQVAASVLPIDLDLIDFVAGDTGRVSYGVGSFGSRTAALAGSAVFQASQDILKQAQAIAAQMMEAAPDAVQNDGHIFRLRDTNHVRTWAQIAAAGTLTATARAATPDGPVFPNGCHVCEVEIDGETGHLRIERYSVVDDVGTILNPQIVEGQIHGGVIQGLSQVWGEMMAYDTDTGQPLTGSLMDYALMRAADVPMIATAHNPQPTLRNPLGVKGAGEAGTVGALPAMMSAVNDALATVGAKPLDMPATPYRIWQSITSSS